ncbi:MAG: hypothetical protein IAF58_14965, partial [Leptolyngbya sp.]|nr:hypothetical protein [Candidatus Melainabacteria bacterium]
MNQADSTENENLGALMQAQKFLDDGQLEECLQLVKSHWLNNPQDTQACALLARVMNEAGHGDLAGKLERLSGILNSDDKLVSTELFESSHALIDIRQHDLASMLLNSDDKLVSTELFESSHALIDIRQHDLAS